jgi:hypothetical protein
MGNPATRNMVSRPDPGPNWVDSSLSFSNGNCVEVASLPPGEVGIRNSRDREGAVLVFAPDEWHAFFGENPAA